MRLLLDTHAFLWWLDGDRRIRPAVRRLIALASTDVFVSAATVWEITTKARIGKLPGAAEVASDVPAAIYSQAFSPIPISVGHAQRAGALIAVHRDPFDRMLAAQALLEGMPIVSIDGVFDELGVERRW